jgi:DNA mismatch repair protein MutL
VIAAARDAQPARILELPASLAGLIAAGEVIERPAAAVKELIENACDAGARRIEIEIEGAGLERILVRDDGAGISAADLPLALRRHATSKLRALEDLERLRSYGFRGEALPSIAAVSDFECVSRARGAPLGARLRMRGDLAAATIDEVGAPTGTTIELRELFARQPARRRFLAGPRSERAAIARVCAEAALARPDIALSLRSEGRRLLVTPGGDGPIEQLRRAAFAAVWSDGPAMTAIAFRGERPLDGAAEPLRVEGLAAGPEHHRARRDGLQIFVNTRPISSRALARAVEQAYAELLPHGRYPLAAVFLEAPGERVDVNVHPAKTTVKLADERAAFALIQRSLRAALLDGSYASPADTEAPAGMDAATRFPAPPPYLSAAPATPTATPTASRAVALLAPLRPTRHTTRYTTEHAAADATLDSHALIPAGLPGRLPLLRLVGQLRVTFLVTEGPEGMVLIDQHAAHERVVYERLIAANSSGASGATGPPAQQALLEPALIELDAAQAAAWQGYAGELAGLGFAIEPFGERTLRLRALPASLHTLGREGGRPAAPATATAAHALEGILDDLAGRVPSAEAVRNDPVAASAACHGSVRAGMTLATAEMSALLRDLEACDNPRTCPHGRPTLIAFAAADLERQFGRR